MLGTVFLPLFPVKPDLGNASWRWDGENWQHHHGYPIGHVVAKYKPEIKKEVTEEWIEEKTRRFATLMYNLTQHEPHLANHHFNQTKIKDFIRKLVEDLK